MLRLFKLSITFSLCLLCVSAAQSVKDRNDFIIRRDTLSYIITVFSPVYTGDVFFAANTFSTRDVKTPLDWTNSLNNVSYYYKGRDNQNNLHLTRSEEDKIIELIYPLDAKLFGFISLLGPASMIEPIAVRMKLQAGDQLFSLVNENLESFKIR